MRGNQNPKSPPPASPPPQGVSYPNTGLQCEQEWTGTEADERSVCEKTNTPQNLYRVTARGSHVELRLRYGTSGNREISGLLTPLTLFVPGNFTLYAKPHRQAPIPGDVVVTLVQVVNSGEANARRILEGDALFNVDARSFFAFEASVVVFETGAVNVPAMARIPLVASARLLSGSGFEEYET